MALSDFMVVVFAGWRGERLANFWIAAFVVVLRVCGGGRGGEGERERKGRGRKK